MTDNQRQEVQLEDCSLGKDLIWLYSFMSYFHQENNDKNVPFYPVLRYIYIVAEKKIKIIETFMDFILWKLFEKLIFTYSKLKFFTILSKFFHIYRDLIDIGFLI